MSTINEQIFTLALAFFLFLIGCVLARREMAKWKKRPLPCAELKLQQEQQSPQPEIAPEAIPHQYWVPDRTGYEQ